MRVSEKERRRLLLALDSPRSDSPMSSPLKRTPTRTPIHPRLFRWYTTPAFSIRSGDADESKEEDDLAELLGLGPRRLRTAYEVTDSIFGEKSCT
jgi:hypothetical protein